MCNELECHFWKFTIHLKFNFMKTILKNGIVCLSLFSVLALGSCKKAAEQGTESDVTTITDSTAIDMDTVKVKDSSTTKPLLRTNSEDGANSGT